MSHERPGESREKIARYNATVMKYVVGGLTPARKGSSGLNFTGGIKRKKKEKKRERGRERERKFIRPRNVYRQPRRIIYRGDRVSSKLFNVCSVCRRDLEASEIFRYLMEARARSPRIATPPRSPGLDIFLLIKP